MQDIFLKILYFARPLMGISVNVSVLGLGFFEFVTLIFAVILFVAVSLSAVRRQSLPVPLTLLDVIIVVFCVYCVIIFVGFWNVSSFLRLIKLLLPPITFFLLKRAITDRHEHVRLIRIMLLAFAVPITGSVLLISQGISEQKYIYWTGFVRYAGMYNGSHELAHSMAFFVMAFLIYLSIKNKIIDSKKYRLKMLSNNDLYNKIAGFALSIGGTYCIYWAQVRTAMIGLFVFITFYLWFMNKKIFLIFSVILVISLIVFQDRYAMIFYDFMSKDDLTQVEMDTRRIGSGRFAGAEQRFSLYANLPFLQQLLGIGIGNFRGFREPDKRAEMLLSDAHNDWMQILLELGAFGFILVATMYVAILRAILRIPTRERYAFLSLWVAVVVMNAGSNSYISRVPIGQMFFMILIYIELAVPPIVSKVGTAGKRLFGVRRKISKVELS